MQMLGEVYQLTDHNHDAALEYLLKRLIIFRLNVKVESGFKC